MPRILLIDDDEQLGPPLAAYFRRYELVLEQATRPSTGLARLQAGGFDAAILDVMLPEMDGFELCRTIRKASDLPLVMLTARGDVMDRVVGLELGADDYLPKPFEPRELVARIQTVLRRRVARPALAPDTLAFEGLTIDTARRAVLRGGEAVELTGTEYELLLVLARDPGRRVQPRRHPQCAARPRDRAGHPRSGHRGQPAAQEAGAAGRDQDAAQRRLFAGPAQGRRMKSGA